VCVALLLNKFYLSYSIKLVLKCKTAFILTIIVTIFQHKSINSKQTAISVFIAVLKEVALTGELSTYASNCSRPLPAPISIRIG